MTDPVSVKEIADRLGLKPGTVWQWKHRGKLPEPDYPLAIGDVWEWDTILEWRQDDANPN